MNAHPRTLTLLVSSALLLLAFVSSISAQTPDSSTKSQSPNEGIQKRDNEWGVWGGMSFDSTTLIGKTPDAKFGTSAKYLRSSGGAERYVAPAELHQSDG